MRTVIDIVVIVLLFGFFGFIHSFLASNQVKKNLAEKAGLKIAFYRLFYNIVSLVIIIAFFEIAPQPDRLIYELHYPFDIIVFSLQAVSLLGLVWTFMYMDPAELSGAAQIKRYYKGVYKIEDSDAKKTMHVKGPYRMSRHPLYFFFILFMGFRPSMDLFFLVLFVCSATYCFIGAHFEEKKLIETFGGQYLEYSARTGRIFPAIINLKKGKKHFAAS